MVSDSYGCRANDRFYNIVLYQVVLSCILGAIIGYVARKVLRFAEEREYVRHLPAHAYSVASSTTNPSSHSALLSPSSLSAPSAFWGPMTSCAVSSSATRSRGTTGSGCRPRITHSKM